MIRCKFKITPAVCAVQLLVRLFLPLLLLSCNVFVGASEFPERECCDPIYPLQPSVEPLPAMPTTETSLSSPSFSGGGFMNINKTGKNIHPTFVWKTNEKVKAVSEVGDSTWSNEVLLTMKQKYLALCNKASVTYTYSVDDVFKNRILLLLSVNPTAHAFREINQKFLTFFIIIFFSFTHLRRLREFFNTGEANFMFFQPYTRRKYTLSREMLFKTFDCRFYHGL